MADRNSWTKNYDEVDFNVPFLADDEQHGSVMPPSSASVPSPPKTPPSTFPRTFPSSPLNPSTSSSLRSNSRPSSMGRFVARIPSEEARAFSHPPLGLGSAPSRGSMILYRCADTTTFSTSPSSNDEILLPPQPSHTLRSSMYSTSGDSIVTLSSDSKYPLTGERTAGLIAYAYDPDLDEKDPPDEEDMMHDPTQRYHHDLRKGKGGILAFNPRGLINITTIVAMILAIVCLFVGYPVIAYYRDNGKSELITGNTRVNATGQVPFSSFKPGDNSLIGSFSDYIDRSTPSNAFSFTGLNSVQYDLVFSDEFNYTSSTYKPNDNLFWVGRNSGVSSPDMITTSDSQLVFNLTSTSPTQFKSGILDSTIPFCLGRGFIVVGMQTATGTEAKLYWGGSWQYTDASPDNFVPAGLSLNTDLNLNLSIGVFTDKIPPGTSSDSLFTSYAIDYVRYYQRKIDPLETKNACDVRSAEKRDVELDLGNLPR